MTQTADPPVPPPRETWHDRAAEAVLAGLRSAPTGLSAEEARSSAFATLVFAELFRSFGARSESKPVWRVPLFSNRNLVLVVAISFGLQILSQHNATLGHFLKASSMTLGHGLLLLGLGAIPLLGLEAAKVIRARRRQPAESLSPKARGAT